MYLFVYMFMSMFMYIFKYMFNVNIHDMYMDSNIYIFIYM
jgi:hypothetical protein